MSFFRKLLGPPNIENLKSRRDLDGLVKALHYQDSPQVRQQAARALGEMGDRKALNPLLSVLQNSKEQQSVRWNAATAIGQLKDAGGLKPLLVIAQNKQDVILQSKAIKAIGQITDPQAAREHVAALAISNKEIQKASTHALQVMSRQAVDALVEGLQHKDGNTRILIIELLGASGDRRAMAPLLGIMKDDHMAEVRLKAMKALVSMGGVPPKEAFIVASNDPSAMLRAEAARQLGSIGGVEVVEALIECLDDESVNVQQTALQALGKSKDKRLIKPLMKVAESDDEALRKRAFDLLEDLGEEAVEALITLLKSKHEYVRALAVDSLAKIGDKRSIDPLVTALQDESKQVRYKTANALQKLGWSASRDISGAMYWRLLEKWEKCAQTGDDARDLLFEAFCQSGFDDRLQIAQVLGRRGDQRCTPGLIQMLAETTKQLIRIDEESNKFDSEDSGEERLAAYMNDDSPGHATYRMEMQEKDKMRERFDQRRETARGEAASIVKTLEIVTHHKLGEDPDKWRFWWEKEFDGGQD